MALLLGLLASMTTLRADLFPDLLSDLLPPLHRQVLALGICCVLATIAALVSRSSWPRGRMLRSAILVGFGLFVVPAFLSQWASGAISPVTRAAILPLASLFAVVFEPHLSALSTGQSRSALLAAIAASAGTLLVLPITLPESLEASLAWLGMGLAAASIGAGSCIGFGITALAYDSETPRKRDLSMASFAAVASGTGFLGLGLVFALTDPHAVPWQALPSTVLWTSATEVPALGLLFCLMPRLSAPRMTTRFTLALLFPVFAGALLLGSRLSPRDWGGVAMMIAGTAYLLLAPEEQTAGSGLSLR